MPSKSEKQKEFMQIVYAYKKGEKKDVTDTIKKAADEMTLDQIKDFISEGKINSLICLLEKATNKKVLLKEDTEFENTVNFVLKNFIETTPIGEYTIDFYGTKLKEKTKEKLIEAFKKEFSKTGKYKENFELFLEDFKSFWLKDKRGNLVNLKQASDKKWYTDILGQRKRISNNIKDAVFLQFLHIRSGIIEERFKKHQEKLNDNTKYLSDKEKAEIEKIFKDNVKKNADDNFYIEYPHGKENYLEDKDEKQLYNKFLIHYIKSKPKTSYSYGIKNDVNEALEVLQYLQLTKKIRNDQITKFKNLVAEFRSNGKLFSEDFLERFMQQYEDSGLLDFETASHEMKVNSGSKEKKLTPLNFYNLKSDMEKSKPYYNLDIGKIEQSKREKLLDCINNVRDVLKYDIVFHPERKPRTVDQVTKNILERKFTTNTNTRNIINEWVKSILDISSMDIEFKSIPGYSKTNRS